MPEPAPRAPVPARRTFRYVLYTLGALTLILAALATYLAASFDANDYRQRVVDLVREKTGRTLEIRDIGLSYWPDLAVRLEGVSLSERESAERFASVETVRVRLQIAPLLDRKFVASELLVDGATVVITRYEDGRLNVDDLLAGGGETPRFDIARFALARSTLAFRDLASGRDYRFANVALETGRLTEAGASAVRLSLDARDAAAAFDLHARLSGQLALDLRERRYALSRAELKLKGHALGITDATLRARGDVTAERGSSTLTFTTAEIELEGVRNRTERIAVNAAAGALVHRPGEASGRDVRAGFVAKGPAGTTQVSILLPVLARQADVVASGAASVAVKIARGAHTLEARATSPLAANIGARELALEGLSADLAVTGPHTSRGGIRGVVKGDLRVDAQPEGVRVRLAGRLNDSNVKAQVAAAGFAAPVYTFIVDVDRLDLDRYVATEGGSAKTPPRATPAEHLFAPLADIPASGTLTVGVLNAAGAKASNVKVVLK